MLSGDNGILQKATDAKTLTERQSIVEQARTDVLAYQVENKGENLEKSQLKSVLDTYFKDVPTELPDGDELINLSLTTLEKYGTHIIKVSEIYDGNISVSSKAKAASLFEDKAGDEEGVTEGKIHIGDYVNYNPIASGDTGAESKYKYESLNDYTGVKEAIEDNQITGFANLSQDFTADANLKWRVIGKDGNNIMLTTESIIMPEQPLTVSAWGNISTGYCLYGAKGYINVSSNLSERNEINNIAQIYKNGYGADSSKTRGIRIEDVNKVTGVIASDTSFSPNILQYEVIGLEYGTELIEWNKGSDGWTPQAWLSASLEERNDASNSPGVTGIVNGYGYSGESEELKTANSQIRHELIFGNNDNLKKYWVSGQLIQPANEYFAFFGIGSISGGSIYCSGIFDTVGRSLPVAMGIRPIIYLDENVSLTSTGMTNNITTWNID